MASIEIVVFIKVKPELIETARPIVADLVHETKKEAGVERFDLFQDANEEGTFILIQKWANQEALDNHRKAEHFIKTVTTVKEWLTAPIESRQLKAVPL